MHAMQIRDATELTAPGHQGEDAVMIKAPRSGGKVGGKEKAAMGADDGGIAEGRADVMGRCERECGMRIGS